MFCFEQVSVSAAGVHVMVSKSSFIICQNSSCHVLEACGVMILILCPHDNCNCPGRFLKWQILVIFFFFKYCQKHIACSMAFSYSFVWKLFTNQNFNQRLFLLTVNNSGVQGENFWTHIYIIAQQLILFNPLIL